MAFCPNCKTEYQDGITTCADCGAALVAELPHDGKDPLYRLRSKELFDKLTAYLDYCKLPYETDFREEDESYELYSVKPKYNLKITQAFETVVNAEAERELEAKNKENAEEDGVVTYEEEEALEADVSERLNDAEMNDISEAAYSSLVNEEAVSKLASSEFKRVRTYEPLSHKASESKSSGIMLVVFSILGAAFVILNMIHVLTIFGAAFTQYVLLGFFIVLFFAGIWSIHGAKVYASEAALEEKSIEELKDWMKQNISSETLKKDGEDTFSEEERMINEQQRLYDLAAAQFPDLDETLLTHFTDEFYTENYVTQDE